ncbi:M48 family metallopeptidase [Flavobacteriales bacterium]|nr:M48 family metallopeptidase [Flavobacteriales bacterium]
MIIKRITIFFVFLPVFLLSQEQNFKTDYNQSECKGTIPEKLLQSIYDKVSVNVLKDTSLSRRNKKNNIDFYESSNYYLENLLRSGKVLFGDEMTNYVKSVTDNLLTRSKNESLKKYISVFVIKVEEVNAFAMQDGSIFITVGLLAQVENEAELAFVIAHEIAHFEKRHGVEIFNEKLKSDKNLRRGASNINSELKRLSNYSKSSEFEADKEGYKMYVDAGYNPEMGLMMLEVLKYSHLPFDNLIFDKKYFNKSNYKIPLDHYKSAKSTDDISENTVERRLASHPNINQRIDRLDSLFSPEGNSVNYFLDKSKFNYINTKARFENLYLGLIGKKFVRVIYESYLLEKTYPNNKYLKRCIAFGLYGISKLKLSGSYIENNTFENYDMEGEIVSLNSLLTSHMSEKELLILAISKLNELRGEKDLKQYRIDLMSNLVNDLGFDFKKLFKQSEEVKASKEKYVDTQGDFKVLDSLAFLKLTKVEKINYKKAKNEWEQKAKDIESAKEGGVKKNIDYYENIFSDLTTEDELFKEFESIKGIKKTKNSNLIFGLIRKKVNIDSIAILEPIYLDYRTKLSGRKEVHYVESIKKKNKLNESISRVSKIYNKNIFNLNTVDGDEINIEKLNIDFLFKEWYNEIFENEDLDMLSFSQVRIDPVFDKIQCNNLMIVVVMDDRVRRNRTYKYIMFLNRNGEITFWDYIDTKKKGQVILNEMFINDVFSKITKK